MVTDLSTSGGMDTGLERMDGGKAEAAGAGGTGVSGARWWVLGVFSTMGLVQCMLWNTWGPVGPKLQIKVVLFLTKKW